MIDFRTERFDSFLICLAVNKIKQETDVMINIPETNHGTTSIRIEGSKDGVQKAKNVSSKLSSEIVHFVEEPT